MRQLDMLDSETPRLAIIKVGNDVGARSYGQSLLKKAEASAEHDAILFDFPEDVLREEVEALIKELNISDKIDGVIGLTPTSDVCWGVYDEINPDKDLDCQTPINFEKFRASDVLPPYYSATAEAVFDMIPAGVKKVAIAGNGRAVGEPLSFILRDKGIDFVLLDTHPDHQGDGDWNDILRESGADVVIGATRMPHSLNESNLPLETLKHVIDVAYCSGQGDSVVGNFDEAGQIAPALETLIRPNEVGHATAAILLQHLTESYMTRIGKFC